MHKLLGCCSDSYSVDARRRRHVIVLLLLLLSICSVFLTSSFCQLSNFFFCCWFELLAIIGGGARVWGAEELRTRVQMRSLFTLSLFLKQNMIGPKHPSLRNTWTDLRNTSAICVNMVPASYRQVLCLDCRLTLLSVTRCLGFITSCDTTQSVMGCLVSCSTT